MTNKKVNYIIIIVMIFLASCQQSKKESVVKVNSNKIIQSADLILKNGRVYSLNWDEPSLTGIPAKNAPYDKKGWHPDAQAIAIRADKVVFVGRNEEAMKYQSTQTEIVDLNSAVVVPGLIDSHGHVGELGEMLHRVNLVDAASPEDAIIRIKKFMKNVYDGDWVLGQGWDEGAWANNYPTRQMLDKHFPNNPVYLKSLHGFAGWGNSMAFELAGITKDTAAPVGGEILKDKSGELLGIVLNRATTLMNDSIPEVSDKQFETFISDGLKKMTEDGFVGVHQAGAGSQHMKAFESLRKNNVMPARVYAMLSARDEPLSHQWIKKGPKSDHDGWLDVVAVKAYYDGALGSRGARMIEDYSDKPGHKGVSGGGYGFNSQIVEELMHAGFQVGIHAIGDAGNRETLDFIQSVITKNPKTQSNRHRIEHAQIIHPDDIGRLNEMSIIASMEPPHAVEDKTWAEERVGSERIKYAYAWRELRKAGVALTFNSDSPGSDHSIFYGLHAAITRRDKNQQPPNGWYSEQNMSPEEALRAYTSWAAFSAFRENDTGVIKAGNWADLTVMDIDPMQLGEKSPGEILDGSILMTFIAGKNVYTAQQLKNKDK